MVNHQVCFPVFTSGADLPVGAALGRLGVVLSLLTVATRKCSRSQTVKQGKDNVIMLLAQSKFDSIADIISKAMQDRDIFPPNFTKYCKRGKNIINLRPILETEPRPR